MRGSDALTGTLSQPTGERPGTAFEAVQGGGETRSGETLLIEGYAFIWLVLMGYVFMLWRKQKVLHTRIDELEAAMDRAAKK